MIVTLTQSALITGGFGFIGSHIAKRLLSDQLVDQVVLLDHFGGYINPLQPNFFDYRKLRIQGMEKHLVIERGEASSPHLLYSLLSRYKPSTIFHLAAVPLASLENLSSEEAMKGNIISTAALFESIHTLYQVNGYKPNRFVYTSSSMVYGDFQYHPADEQHPTQPKGLYATMKLAGEVVTRGLAHLYQIPYTIIRPSAVYGPTDMNQRVSQIFIEKALKGETLKVAGTDVALDFTYVKDVAKGFVLAATHAAGINETFNITHGHSYTLLEYVEALKSHFPDLKYEVLPRDKTLPRRGALNIAKARQRLGFVPDYDLNKGLAEYVAFIKQHHPPDVKR